METLQDAIDYIHDCILCEDPIINYDVQVNITSCEYDPYYYMKGYKVDYEITFPNDRVVKDSTHLLEPIALGAYKSPESVSLDNHTK